MRQRIVRILVYGAVLVAAFVLQTSVFHFFLLADIAPNLLLIVTVASGLMGGRKQGMAVGFFAGLLTDIFFGEYLGAYSFIYLMFGYINGFFSHLFYVEDMVFPVVMIAVNDLAYGTVIYLVYYLMRAKWDFLFYARRIILPEAAYTAIVGIAVFFVLLKIDDKLRDYEKRSG